MSTVVDGIGQHLAANVAGWDYATGRALDPAKVPVTVGGPLETADTAVTLNTYPGGPEPDSANGWEYPRLQVRVRAMDPLAALELDRAAYDVLQAAVVTLAGGQLLSDCYALQSEAQPLGQDSNGRWEFARNYQLVIELA
jgi:hypothetical protein